MNRYLEQFIKLRCHEDVMSAVGNINNPSKEITESMAIIKKLKKVKDKENIILVDLCAGNCLTSVIAAHLYNFKKVIAVDIRPPSKDTNFDRVKNFEYRQDYVRTALAMFRRLSAHEKYIFISVHPCRELATTIIKEFNEIDRVFWDSPHSLLLMPCCIIQSVRQEVPTLLQEKLGHYGSWCYYLYSMVSHNNKNMYQDNYIESPCNILVTVNI